MLQVRANATGRRVHPTGRVEKPGELISSAARACKAVGAASIVTLGPCSATDFSGHTALGCGPPRSAGRRLTRPGNEPPTISHAPSARCMAASGHRVPLTAGAARPSTCPRPTPNYGPPPYHYGPYLRPSVAWPRYPASTEVGAPANTGTTEGPAAGRLLDGVGEHRPLPVCRGARNNPDLTFVPDHRMGADRSAQQPIRPRPWPSSCQPKIPTRPAPCPNLTPARRPQFPVPLTFSQK
jgi:hypothetical protein